MTMREAGYKFCDARHIHRVFMQALESELGSDWFAKIHDVQLLPAQDEMFTRLTSAITQSINLQNLFD